MNTKLALRAAAVSVAGVALGAVVGAAGIAWSDERPASSAPVTQARPAAQQVETPVTVEHQHGIVIEGTGALDGEPVGISLYENAQYGNVLQVFFPETDEVGALEQEDPFVVDGHVDVTLDVDGRTVRLAGVVTETGRTKVIDSLQDAGEQQVAKGTQSVLDADLVLTDGGDSVPLEAKGFAFDLDVRHVQLYGKH